VEFVVELGSKVLKVSDFKLSCEPLNTLIIFTLNFIKLIEISFAKFITYINFGRVI
jgi:hypothetical protein